MTTFQFRSKIEESRGHVEQFEAKRNEVLGKLDALGSSHEVHDLLRLSQKLFKTNKLELPLNGIPGKINLSVSERNENYNNSQVSFVIDRENDGLTSSRDWLDSVTAKLTQAASGNDLDATSDLITPPSRELSPTEALERIEEVITQDLTEFAEKVHAAAEALTKRSSTDRDAA